MTGRQMYRMNRKESLWKGAYGPSGPGVTVQGSWDMKTKQSEQF